MVTMVTTNRMWQYVWLPWQGIGVAGIVRYGLWSAGEGGGGDMWVWIVLD
jgi:hypothetical protein